MKSRGQKKLLCLLILIIFIFPTVAGLNLSLKWEQVAKDRELNHLKEVYSGIENVTINDLESNIDSVINFMPRYRRSIEVQEILDQFSSDELNDSIKKYLLAFNDKMLERRARFVRENTRMPYEPLDITGKIARIDPETGETSCLFPKSQLKPTKPKMVTLGNSRSPTYFEKPVFSTNTIYPDSHPSPEPYITSSQRKTRALEADVELTALEWDSINEGWEDAFQIGKTTIITAIVENNDPLNEPVSVWVNFSIRDWYTLKPMQRNPTSYLVNVSIAPVEVIHKFTPPFAGNLLIQCSVEYINDPDNSNNYLGWYDIPVLIWSADFEESVDKSAEASGFGWQTLVNGTLIKHNLTDWTGQIADESNSWHITGYPANQNAPSHTKPNTWFHGEDRLRELPDTYADNIRPNTFLQTPYINMGDILDGSETVGDLPENTFYLDYMPMFGLLMTGELEGEDNAQNNINWNESDIMLVCEYNDDLTDNWLISPYPYNYAYVAGDYSTLEYHAATPQTTPHWNPNYHGIVSNQQMYLSSGYPFRLFVSDGNGDVKEGDYGARNWTSPGVRFRCNFTGDYEDDQSSETGIYVDDFVTWGMQEYSVENDVGFTTTGYPTSSGDVSILYKESTASLRASIKNYGLPQNSLPVVFKLEDVNGTVLGDYSQIKSAGNLNTDDEKDISFSWMPKEEGDFYLILEVGDYEADWTPGDNRIGFYIHVRSAIEEKDIEILVVDDDNSIGQGGIFRINVEDRMLKALRDNDMKYRIYTVEYNETGPAVEVMDDYELVIWLTGLDNEVWAHGGRPNYNKNNPDWDITLKEDDIIELESYLNLMDKRLWLISPGFLFDYYGIEYKAILPGDFAREFLHIYNSQPNLTQYDDNGNIVVRGTPNPLEGVEDSIMDEAVFTTYEDKPPNGFADIGGSVGKEVGDENTDYEFYQDAAHLGYNSVQYNGEEFKTSYYAFNYYLISDPKDRVDCVFKMLTCFRMSGGVQVELLKPSEELKTVYPGMNATYQLRVTNKGKKTDTMELSVNVEYLNDYPSKYKNWNPRFVGEGIEIIKGKPTVTLDGQKWDKEVYLKVTAPKTDDFSTYPTAGGNVKFIVIATSTNTKLDNSTIVKAQIPVLGNITISPLPAIQKMEVNDKTEFLIELYNETNSADDVNVELSYSGEGADLAQFAVKNKATNKKEVSLSIAPNEINDDVELWMSSNEHTLAGKYNVSVQLTNSDNNDLKIHDQVNISVDVSQFYKVECNLTEYFLEKISDREIIQVINPNNYTDDVEEYITKTFKINVRNFGNSYDNISLYWEHKSASRDIFTWPEPRIYSESEIENNITSINVKYYDESNKYLKYGQESIYFDVYIPLDTDEGIYEFDFVIKSSGSEIGGTEELENNRIIFGFQIQKPNLVFSEFDPEGNPNFDFYDSSDDEFILEDLDFGGYYIEKEESDFNDFELEIQIYLINNKEAEVEFDPGLIWLNITHYDKYANLIHDANFSKPSYPTDIKYIVNNQREKFIFNWEPDTEASEKSVEYIFKITIDPENKIYETNEDDNSAEFKLTIRNKKPSHDQSQKIEISTIGLALIIIIVITILLILFMKRRNNKQNT